MLQNSHCLSSFETARHSPPATGSKWPILTVLRNICGAFSEGVLSENYIRT
jgi:hypothetical protein